MSTSKDVLTCQAVRRLSLGGVTENATVPRGIIKIGLAKTPEDHRDKTRRHRFSADLARRGDNQVGDRFCQFFTGILLFIF